MFSKYWEVGSEFEWAGIPEGPFLKWPEPNVMFGSGRAVLPAIFQCRLFKTLFVPDYFCQDVTKCWMEQGLRIKQYIDGPNLKDPLWNTLKVEKGDAVLALNYFGLRDGTEWKRWQDTNRFVLLIEDHSHDPFSGWALRSTADFAFASIRKTFPVPDGAILWSPKGLSIPNEPVNDCWHASAFKLAAMVLKKEYFEEGNENIKDIYRKFQIEGEKIIENPTPISISPWSKYLLSNGYPVKWREKRKQNISAFLNALDESSIAHPLFTTWPETNCPFNAVLLFSSNSAREKCRKQLIQANIYPAIHWELNSTLLPENLQLSKRIMTIPVDQRYSTQDIDQIITTVFKESANV